MLDVRDSERRYQRDSGNGKETWKEKYILILALKVILGLDNQK
jgi:hypothetical protein